MDVEAYRRALIEEKLENWEMARRFGISMRRVLELNRKLGICGSEIRLFDCPPPYDMLDDLYRVQKWTVDQMALHFRVSSQTMRYWLLHQGIHIRTRREALQLLRKQNENDGRLH